MTSAAANKANRVGWAGVLAAQALIVLSLLLLAEAGLRCFWTPPPSALDQHYTEGYFYMDPFGITKARPDGRYPSSERDARTGKTIYDVVYSVDEHSRRITPVDAASGRTKHLLFFGCSFTYGEGVKDDQTIPARAAARARAFMPYNYAFHGDSPIQLLAKLQSNTLKDEVPQKDGDLVFVFIDNHIKRVVGSMRMVTSYEKNRPYYRLGPREELVRDGTFETGRPVLQRIYLWLAGSALLKYAKADFPLWVTDAQLRLTARMIEESARLYREQFPGGKFYFLIFPGSRYGGEIARRLPKGVEVLDYSRLIDMRDPSNTLSPDDQHPSARADKAVGERLALDLAGPSTTIW